MSQIGEDAPLIGIIDHGSTVIHRSRVCGDSAHGGLQIAAFSASGAHVLKYAARRFSKSTIFAAP
ncbi:hypothetical protein M527_21450 [Sphingobium indicum IP26]|nr:hypothetical protein M527_21450 [Sphingobium indicum IP26]